MIYFDHNATGPMLAEAKQAWLSAVDNYIGNPSSPHRVGARADTALGAAREQLAGFLGCHPLEIVWTSGATESNNMVLHHAALSLPGDAEVWCSSIEHPAVLSPADHYFGKRVRKIPVGRDGVADVDWIAKGLKKARPGLVAVMADNNESGVLQPWQEIAALCKSQGVPYFCDATQWLGKLPAQGLGGCDFVSGSGHKFGGPRGVGFLKCPSNIRWNALVHGGPQEEGRRAGTENVAGALAMMAALEMREKLCSPAIQPLKVTKAAAGQEVSPEIAKRLGWRKVFEQEMLQALPGSVLVAGDAPRLWNTVSALMPTARCDARWVVKLDKAGFAVSTGSACASGKEAPSHVLSAMGYSPAEASRALRFSSGWETTEADWSALKEALARLG